MKGATTQLQLANPRDWCTYAWAAEKLCVSVRTVERLVDAGVLGYHQPRKARTEDPKRGRMLYVADVERAYEARTVLAGGRA